MSHNPHNPAKIHEFTRENAAASPSAIPAKNPSAAHKTGDGIGAYRALCAKVACFFAVPQKKFGQACYHQ
jgi:hypothetical protein